MRWQVEGFFADNFLGELHLFSEANYGGGYLNLTEVGPGMRRVFLFDYLYDQEPGRD